MLLDGRNALTCLINSLLSKREIFKNMKILVIFENDAKSAPLTSLASAREKIRVFEILGATVQIVTSSQVLTNNDSCADGNPYVVFQRPFSVERAKEIMDKYMFVDLENIFTQIEWHGLPAVVEAVLRVIMEFYKPGDSIAVVGGKGFFGSKVVDACQRLPCEPIIIDEGDALETALEADILVTTAGVSRLLDDRHVSAKQVVIDVGFAARDDVIPLYDGDVGAGFYHIPRYITPVPGGVGPLQIACLVERAVFAATGKNTARWSVSKTNCRGNGR